MQRSTANYSADLDKRDIMQEFLQKVAPFGGKLKTNRSLTKEEALKAVTFLQSQ